MANIDIRLSSGLPVEIETSTVKTIGEARRKVSDLLALPACCLKLVSNTGDEPNDEDPIDMIITGVTTLVILNDKLQEFHEQPIIRACDVDRFTDLVNRRLLTLVGKSLFRGVAGVFRPARGTAGVKAPEQQADHVAGTILSNTAAAPSSGSA